MHTAADELVCQYEENKFPDWHWFEDILTYDNAVLPHALFVASRTLGDKYLEIAIKTCKFLLNNTYNGDHFSFIGCNGWYGRDGKKAKWDQQPIEAASTVIMLHEAYDITKDKEYLKLQRKAFDWFLGDNDLRIPVYNFRSKGCHDGLTPNDVNLNQGAESTLSFLMALLTVIEGYVIAQKITKAVQKEREKSTNNVPVKDLNATAAKQQKIQELT